MSIDNEVVREQVVLPLPEDMVAESAIGEVRVIGESDLIIWHLSR